MKRTHAVRGLVTGVIASGALLVAAPGASANVGCYQPEGSRMLRIIPEAKSCQKGERRISWDSVGAKGETGAKGAKGAKGEAGATGAQGAKGDAGSNGAQGAKGDTGSQGVQGAKGDQGSKGDQGDTGAAGAQGIQGEQGAQGIQGEQGDAGAQGVQGIQGLQGVTGQTGAPGIPGATGAAGAAGADGAAGPQGPGGPAGPQGPVGADGPQGSQGPQGPQGPAGVDGDSGPAGLDGPEGPAGPTGPEGPAGAAGAATIMTSNSDGAVSVTTLVGGLQGTLAVLPLSGSDVATATASGGTLDLMSSQLTGQVVGRAGTITSVRGFASTTAAMTLIGSTVTATVSVWKASGNTQTFSPIPGASAQFNGLTGVLSTGTSVQGSTTGLSIPVDAGDRLVVVVGATASGLSLVNTLPITVTSSVTIQ